MREILFRGKTLTGQWVEGAYYKQEEFYGDSEDASIIITSKETLDYDQALFFSVVISETVGQYTGLCDKNGKKIFEGDILDCGDRIVYVKWHDQCGTWDCNFIRYKGELCSNGISPVDWKYRAVVIGNRYDNPELLKGGAK